MKSIQSVSLISLLSFFVISFFFLLTQYDAVELCHAAKLDCDVCLNFCSQLNNCISNKREVQQHFTKIFDCATQATLTSGNDRERDQYYSGLSSEDDNNNNNNDNKKEIEVIKKKETLSYDKPELVEKSFVQHLASQYTREVIIPALVTTGKLNTQAPSYDRDNEEEEGDSEEHSNSRRTILIPPELCFSQLCRSKHSTFMCKDSDSSMMNLKDENNKNNEEEEEEEEKKKKESLIHPIAAKLEEGVKHYENVDMEKDDYHRILNRFRRMKRHYEIQNGYSEQSDL